MLGEQIADLKGKIISQRVLDAEGPTIETSVSFSGNIRNVPVKQNVTFVGRPTSQGVLNGKGQAVIMAGETDSATFTAEAFGRVNTSGSIKWRGAFFYRTLSGEKLAFINNVVGMFEAEIDTEGNVTEKSWEWK